MDYFSYLSITKKEDNKKTFINYLIEIKSYTREEAEKQAVFYYEGDQH